SSDDLYKFLLNTADKQIVLKVGPNAGDAGSRDVTVVPIAEEISLRHRDWVVNNLRTVDRLSGGRVGYVYLPDTASGVFTSFNRYFFAQVGKQGVIMDDRFNSGGQSADYIINYLQRKLLNFWYTL